MPYASGRVIHDADAHIMEVPGFLEDHLEARHRAAVTDQVLFPRHEGFHSTRLKADPAAPFDEAQIMLRKNWEALGHRATRTARARSTCWASPASYVHHGAAQLFLGPEGGRDVELTYAVARAHTRHMVEFCSSTADCCRQAMCRWSTSSAPPERPAKRSNSVPRR